MNDHVDELLLVRAEIHGLRSMLRLLVMGESDVDIVDGLLLAESAENRINTIIETTGGNTMQKCICSHDMIERIEQHPTVKAVSDQIAILRKKLLTSLSPEQCEMFRLYDDATLQEGTVRVQAALMLTCGNH